MYNSIFDRNIRLNKLYDKFMYNSLLTEIFDGIQGLLSNSCKSFHFLKCIKTDY